MKSSKAHLEAMRAWRRANPGYMKAYYATNPIQKWKHRRMTIRNYWRMRLDPVKWAEFLAESRVYQRAYRARKKTWTTTNNE